jgi:hypothetical protein
MLNQYGEIALLGLNSVLIIELLIDIKELELAAFVQ